LSRFAALLSLALAACSFHADYDGTHYKCGAGDVCPDGFSCVAGACVLAAEGGPDAGSGDPPDGGPASGTWTSDSAQDFGAGGYVANASVIDPRGSIEPVAYYTGGLLESASPMSFSSGAGADWAQVSAFPSTGARSLARNTDVGWGSGVPAGVGLTTSDNWTLRVEGEIWLDAGDWSFYAYFDDHGFVDLDDGGGWKRVVSADFPNEASGPFHASASGWYPIRWAVSDTGGNASMRVRYQGPGVSQPSSISHNKMRARVDGLTGLAEFAFDGDRFDGDRAITIDAVSPANDDWAGGAPKDLEITGTDDWSLRWVGQWRVETAGTYALRYSSDDGQRLWLDGTRLTNAWDQNSHELVTAPVQLDAGWHDVVIDHSETGGSAHAIVTIDSGPEGAGAALPPDRLRPIEGRGERHEHVANHNDIAIPDAPSASVDGIADSTVGVGAPAGAIVHGVDVGIRYDHEWQGDLVITLIAPSGKTVTLRDQTGNQGGSFRDHYYRTDLDGEAASGTWTVRFTDIDPGAAGTIRDVELTVHTQGAGDPPIAPTAHFESAARDLGATASVTRVAWDARTPLGTTAIVSVRACASPDCAQSSWVLLGDPSGTVPSNVKGRYVQYAVDFTSDGDHVPSVESISIDYGP